MDAILLLADLTDQEGYRSLVYDDATGKKLTKGMTLSGNPTVAIGWNVAGRPCPPDLANIIARYFIDATWKELTAAMPWITSAPEPVQRALTNMSFNMGLAVLRGFTQFLALMQLSNYAAAADDLAGTLWFKQIGSRGPKLQALIKEGIT